MNDSEKLDYLIGEFALLKRELTSADTTLSGYVEGTPPRVYSEDEVTSLTQALAYLGANAPPVEKLRGWLTRTDVPGVLAAVDSYLEAYKPIAVHPSSGLRPGEDWRPVAAFFAVHKSHDLWSGVFPPTSGEIRTAVLPDAGALPSLFDSLGTPKDEADMAPLVPEVLRRADLGISWAGTRGKDSTGLSAVNAVLSAGPAGVYWLSPEWDEWREPALRDLLLKTNVIPLTRVGMGRYDDVSSLKKMTVVQWLWTQWRTNVVNPGSPFWDGTR